MFKQFIAQSHVTQSIQLLRGGIHLCVAPKAPQSAASSNLKVDRAKPCQRCEVLLLQLDALAQSMVGLAGAAFRWSLEVATGVSTEDREMLWKALMSYMQPCAHVDARIASTSEDLLKAVTKAVTPDELLGSLAQQRLEQKRAQPKGAATAPQAKVKAKAEPKSSSAQPQSAKTGPKRSSTRSSRRTSKSSAATSKTSSRSSSRSSSSGSDYSSSSSYSSSDGSSKPKAKAKPKASPGGRG
ncbi:unnamed protein product [Durusdinium trenchii]|uniref:Uncharacterized protein n=1 Tax=Durusdinium trenchii TaxID=1381693 RepID=A0ABP0J5S3_9DINO